MFNSIRQLAGAVGEAVSAVGKELFDAAAARQTLEAKPVVDQEAQSVR